MNDKRGDKPIALPDDPLWYKDAVIYQAHVKAFFDSNGDGIGDFPGLTAKLDYIQDLGVNTIWVLPFYPSPLRDDGYDIADYHNVHPQYGTRKDFQTFVREAHRRGLRVITELVINHTSDQHPWFQAARRAPKGSAKRDWYVWSDDERKYNGVRIIFNDTEKSNWTYDPVAGQYYWHRFFSHQPDLNFDNPSVLRAVMRTMRFWLDMGVDGMRLDAIPYLVERDGTSCENLPETHAVIKRLRAELDARYRDRMFLAEANQWPEDVRDYFGEGDECHVAYHFPLMPRMYVAIAQEDRHPITEIMAQTPDIPDNCQWAIFLRNHDELTLEMVTSKERDYMYRMYAVDQRARINLGIRRRLAPLLDNDRERIRLMNILLLSMPGSPVIYYGDEIGMGDDIYLGDRDGVRTPMQWTPDRNGGFSRADPQRLYLRPIMDPVFGYEALNVEAQLRDSSSLLNWMKRVLAVRKLYKAFGRGRLTFLHPGNRKILAYLREHEDEAILCVANLARAAQAVELDLSKFKGSVPVELMGRTSFPPVGELPYLLTIAGYGYFWFRLARGEEVPRWHEERMAPETLATIVLFDGWKTFFRERVVPWRIGLADKVRAQLEEQELPRFLAAQRWFAGTEPPARAEIVESAEWEGAPASWLVSLVRVQTGQQQAATYFLPLALVWEEGDAERLRAVLPATIAKVRQQAHPGALADACFDPVFCRELAGAIGARRELRATKGAFRFVPSGRFDSIVGDPAALEARTPMAHSSNTAVRFGDGAFLKLYRLLDEGGNSELEMLRFLTDIARFERIPPLAGHVEYTADGGEAATLALLQGFVANQGDGWAYTLDYLDRFLETRRVAGAPPAEAETHDAFVALMKTLGRRTAELHRALAIPVVEPAFTPVPLADREFSQWMQRLRGDAQQMLDLLERRRDALPVAAREAADALLAARGALLRRIETQTSPRGKALKLRCHGTYHLRQVLVASNDFVIINFEGEPQRALAERREKQLPVRDVAGMLRSFSQAAHAALLRATADRPADRAVFEPPLRLWEQRARQAFLAAWDATARAAGLYASSEEMRGLLELCEIEKALGELRDELAHRPEWVPVPVRGLLGRIGGDHPEESGGV